MPSTTIWIIVYFAVANLFGFASMGMDKYRAQNHKWRISEAMLFFFAIIGGSIGSLIGMRFFRHKTKHKLFTIGIPFVLIIQIFLIIFLWVYPGLNVTIQ
ncbi:MAG: DUF1294 domain-containing protein [Lachnospiraceae bacterium]|nr:DUF1294 domain-containing protein [Lachnospiraceae bacterium]